MAGSGLELWTIYELPRDHPYAAYLARKFINDQPTMHILIADDIKELRRHFHQLGLFRLPRKPQDDPVIVETWL